MLYSLDANLLGVTSSCDCDAEMRSVDISVAVGVGYNIKIPPRQPSKMRFKKCIPIYTYIVGFLFLFSVGWFSFHAFPRVYDDGITFISCNITLYLDRHYIKVE